MGLEIHHTPQPGPVGPLVADRRLYLNREESRLVDESDPECAWLLVAKGHEIPADKVKRLGLVMHEGRVMHASDVPESQQSSVVDLMLDPEPDPSPPAPVYVEPIVEGPEPVMPPQSRRRRRRS